MNIPCTFGASCLVIVKGHSSRKVSITLNEVIARSGRELVSLIRILHQADRTDQWTDSLAPWVLSAVADQLTPQERSLAVIGWLSSHLGTLTERESVFLDPGSFIGLFGIANTDQAVPTYARFENGRTAALACRAEGTDILMLKQAFLAHRNSDATLTELGSLRKLSDTTTLGPLSWVNGEQNEYESVVHPALAAPTIDHLCAYVISRNPELRSCPSLPGDPHIAEAALRALTMTSADALDGSPSTRATIARGGEPGFPLAPPDPFNNESAWRMWLNSPVTPKPFPVSRLLCDVRRRRVDLQEHFPNLSEVRHRIDYLTWASVHATDLNETGLPAWAVPTPNSLPRHRPADSNRMRTEGVTVVGFLDSALGLGEAARVLVRNVQLAGEQVATQTYRHVVSPPVAWRDLGAQNQTSIGHDIQVICLNGSELPRWNRSAPVAFSEGAYRIGLWFWETDRLTPEMAAGAELLDEIWVTSEYTAETVRNSCSKQIPVLVMPLGMLTPPSSTRQSSRQNIRELSSCHLPAQWWCGTSFDVASQVERKNPFAMVEAWKLAFADEPTERVFVIKTMNGIQQPRALATLVEKIESRRDTVLIDETWTPLQQHHFVRALDVYLSLHRSEGYGLMLLEALSVGTPAIATAATGNLAFMNEGNSWLVPSTEHTLDADAGPYRKGSKVSEPNIEVASKHLVDLFENAHPDHIGQIIDKGRLDVAGLVDGSIAAKWLRRRLAEIRRTTTGNNH